LFLNFERVILQMWFMQKQQHYTLTKVRKVKSYLITPLIYFLIGKSCYFLYSFLFI